MKQASAKSKVRKRIVIFGNSAKSMLNFRSGLIMELHDAGHEVYCFAPDMSIAQRSDFLDLGALPYEIDLSRYGFNPKANILSLFQIIRLLKSIKPDILFAFTLKPIIIGLLASKILKIKNFTIMFEGLGYVFRDVSKANLKAQMLRKIISWLCVLAIKHSRRAIFLNAEDARELNGDHYSMYDKIFILGGIGVDLSVFIAAPAFVKPLTFTFVGRMLEEKGIRDFVAAATIIKAENPNVRFLALGEVDTNPATLSAIEVNALKEAGVVEFFGEVSVKPFLEKTSVFVLPSYYREGVPRSTQEAMAMAKPVITTNEIGCKDTVLDGYNGFLVDKNNPKMIAKTMQKFIDVPELIPVMGKHSRLEAEKKFDGYKKDILLMRAMGLKID